MPKLYELVDQLKFLENVQPDKEVSEAPLLELLKGVQLEIDKKVTSLAQYVISLKSDSEAIKEEEVRLYQKRCAITNRVEWIKNYLFTEMRSSMTMQVKSTVCTVSIRTNPVSVEVVSMDSLPNDYKRIIVEPDKKLILEHYKLTGEVLPGTNIITDKESIMIR